MNAKTIWVALLSCFISIGAWPQGYAGLGSDAKGFKKVTPGRVITLPQDYAPHPGYRIEWWYVTANLLAENGEEFGVQWTLFRQNAIPETSNEGWSKGEFWMGHTALTSKTYHRFAEKLARGGIGQAGAQANPFAAWIDDWSFRQTEGSVENTGRKNYILSAQNEDFGYDLALSETGPVILHGDAGYSRKSDDGQASYYFSQPFFEIEGSIQFEGRQVSVKGEAWLDREWSSQPLSAEQKGWDWFSVKFDNGTRMMVFRLRSSDDQYFYAGTWIEANGRATAISPNDIRMRPLRTAKIENKSIPVVWALEVPSKELDVTISALNEKSWMATSFSYWEGSTIIRGSATGAGYLEMTGY